MSSGARPGSPHLGIARSREGDRVTTLELFFDLVYVFGFTQVTSLMAHGEAPMSLVEAFVVLSLLWWSWVSYTWLANEARADQGVLHVSIVVAMVAVFLASLAIPEVFHDEPGGLSVPALVALCYSVVRVAHISAYYAASRRDPALRRQVLLTLGTAVLPTLTLLWIGVGVGGRWLVWVWLLAVLYDFAAIFFAAVGGGGWSVRSASHFTERHGLVVILAIGEEIVAIGTGLSGEPLTREVVIASGLAVGLSVTLWFGYFHHLTDVLENRLAHLHGPPRAKLAREAFTYLHLPIIAGIIVAALGVEEAMAHLSQERLGARGAWFLAAGLAIYLLGTSATARRAGAGWLPVRLVGGAVLLTAAWPLSHAEPTVVVAADLALMVAILAAESAWRRSAAQRPATLS